MVRIAVCSRNGIAVDENFALAACFYIYDVGRNTFGLAGMRLTGKNHDSSRGVPDEEKLNNIYALLSDCEFLFTAMIEPGVRRWLEDKNVTVISGRRSITELLPVVQELKKKEVTHA